MCPMVDHYLNPDIDNPMVDLPICFKLTLRNPYRNADHIGILIAQQKGKVFPGKLHQCPIKN